MFDFRKRFTFNRLGIVECLATGCTYVKDGRNACFQATNKRDKVYASVGLADPASTSGIYPNYRLDIGQTYTQATVSLLKGTGRLDILYFC